MNEVGRRLVRALAAALVVTALTALAAMPASAQEQLPFSGRYTGTVAMNEDQSGATLQGSATASHLGKSTISDVVQILPTGTVSGCPGFRAQHTITLTAANGDQLFISVVDDSCAEGPGLYHGVDEYVITGGTGRFASATGGGTWEGHGDFNTGTFVQTFEGTISY